jgi:hypothetical protein
MLSPSPRNQVFIKRGSPVKAWCEACWMGRFAKSTAAAVTAGQ